MNRVVWFIICTVVGLELIAWGLLVPSHLGAIDAKTLQLAGARSPSLVAEGMAQMDQEKMGPARMILKAAEQVSVPGSEKLAAALHSLEIAQPHARMWGGSALYLEAIFDRNPPSTNLQSQPLIDILVAEGPRETLNEALMHSHRPGVLEILKTRELTNTVLFPPAQSASGQPLDAVISMTALLLQQDQFSTSLRNELSALVLGANKGNDIRPLEGVYLDFLSLGKRLNWGQLIDVVSELKDTPALREASALFREQTEQLALVFAAVHLAGSPHPVVQYLDAFPHTGLKDLTYALGAGTGAARELLDRQLPVYYPTWRNRLVAFAPVSMVYDLLSGLATDHPKLGFVLKYGFCFLGALLLARAVMYLSPSFFAEILASRPLVTGPQVAIALCLLFVLLFFSESLVTRASPAPPVPFRVRLPMASAALRAKIPNQVRTMSDKFSMFSVLTFFVLQALIYVGCRMKLAEIRRQTLPSRLKLRLLENEEHLFDAGLYFGFVGTVVSLILVSMGINKMGLMSAYSSTSFGIIFVSIVKICHVRPYRRRLILDTEIGDRQTQTA